MLTACAAPAQNTAQTEVQETTAASVEETTAEQTTAESETEAVTEAETTAETTEATTEAPAVKAFPEFETKTDEDVVKADDNAEVTLYNGKYCNVSITNADEYSELAEGVKGNMKVVRDAYDYNAGEMKSMVHEHYENSPESFTGEYPMTYYDFSSVSVTRSDEKVFAYVVNNEGYSGGAHGWSMNTGTNFDAQTGKELELGDICNDIPRLVDILAQKLKDNYTWLFDDNAAWVDESVPYDEKPRTLLTSVYGEDLCGYDDTWEDGSVYHMNGMQFVFTPDGVTFFSNSYDLTSYAGGTQFMTVLFSEAEGLFNEKYVCEAGGDFSVRVDYGFDICVDLNGDGTAESIVVGTDYDEENWTVKGFYVKAGDKTYPLDHPVDEFAYDHGVLERKDGKYTFTLYKADDEILDEIALN